MIMLFGQNHVAPAHLFTPVEADCWAISLTVPEETHKLLWKLLSGDERQRAERFRLARDRAAYIASHAALRLFIAAYLGKDPKALIFSRESHGRPTLVDSTEPFHFNLSHSGDIALIAFSSKAEIGVDIEEICDVPDLVNVAKRYFAPLECDHILGLESKKRLLAFFITWTRKEAFVKATGIGLSFPLQSFATGATDRPPSLRVGERDYADWTMVDLEPAPRYRGALAIGRPEVRVRLFAADWPSLLARSV